MNSDGIILKVREAYHRDVGRKIARIDRSTMRKLGVETGDYIRISGKERDVVASVWPLRPEDEGREIIRIDGYLRQALGVGVGDTVTVYKAEKVEPAQKIVLAPLEPLRFGPDFEAYVKEFLMRKPIARGEIIVIPLWEGIPLAVVSTQPAQMVYVTEKTQITIREK
ncbi:MAG: AAA family ATPase, partial [Desulfurococcales archaeon]|nr:AAA family ATPase [Desulfurococcales archaeon]